LGADGAALGGAEARAIGSEPAAVAVVFWLTRLGAVSRDLSRATRLEPDLLNPQECAIDGPAVYPTTAPATAPTGPNTTAPDTAPKAASPPRLWANAAGASAKDMTDARINLFILGSHQTVCRNT
jgi:hypothetical protein